jgi:aspartyl-tRNA(Asn)/glutamyl-tRNA(Gln) amidotransferase subunit C
MSIDRETVRRIARLARLALDEGEAASMETELNALLAWVEQLQELDVEGVFPMTSVAANPLTMREDVVTEGGIAEDLMRNAPETEGHFFVVPKVVE